MSSSSYPPPTAHAPGPHLAWLWPGLLIGTTLAPLLAYNQTPSATLYNQLLALGGWGLVLVAAAWWRLAPLGGAGSWASHGMRAPLGAVPRFVARLGDAGLALLIMTLAALAPPLLTGQPWAMGLASAGLLAAALAVTLLGQAIPANRRASVMDALAAALLLAGLLSVAVSVVQVFMPERADGSWIARSGLAGRAVGNMRQPNHLASLLMWAAVAAVWLAEGGAIARWLGGERVKRVLLPLLLFVLVATIVMSASRTGMLGVLILALWGLLDRRLLSRATRWALLATPLMLGLSWLLLAWWTHSHGQAFGAEARLAEGAGSPSRLAILANAWTLLNRHALTGVGWGEFNLAWTLTPFPDRPIAFFDHTHNLPLQLLVELGWPLGLLVLALLARALLRAWRRSAQQPETRQALAQRAAFMLVLAIGLHSLLEYPLWYAYFLLPTCFALGLALGGSDEGGGEGAQPVEGARVTWALVGAAMTLAALLTVADYRRVVVIYAPPAKAGSLESRIRAGQSSLLFSPQADYAAATTPTPSAQTLEAARRTGHHLIDVRLMMAWARSLDAVGETDKARYLVQRLKEFRSRAGDEWLAECAAVPTGITPPFQCQPPERDYDYRELR
ncbi:Wzy polymerase domain-containing protein [Pelomonas sp. CA6]|uniref:PglL family O-oligosaccharyltransferase n=1 Tax=Pelomonas sp. CA6 TaxID=2907999 RepID=UPI001F4BE0BB|nr:O-antigen ligase family protein [Pelomonas sp. CA6]MCH7343615.1 Wzy polymerase domain-containing protein [Pelomonas sp. CA6]